VWVGAAIGGLASYFEFLGATDMIAVIGILTPIVLLTCYISMTTKVKERRFTSGKRN